LLAPKVEQHSEMIMNPSVSRGTIGLIVNQTHSNFGDFSIFYVQFPNGEVGQYRDDVLELIN